MLRRRAGSPSSACSEASRAGACSRCCPGWRPAGSTSARRALGIAQAAYDAALQYSRDREAFGKPISDFQAIQIKLADMATKIQAARLMIYWAASKADAGERVDMQSGMAKLFASEVAVKAALDAMRIHGGYGY